MRSSLLLAAALAASTLSISGASAATVNCGRVCLTQMLDQYMSAMVKHDPAGLPLAGNVKYTENTAAIPIGDGLWVGASEEPTTFKIYAVDPATGEAGLFCVLQEFGRPVLLALRLKVENAKITEIEHVVARDLRPNGIGNLVVPRPGLLATVPPDERRPRQEMLRIADSYFEAIEHSNGDLAPFADDCVRHENGMQTTSNKLPKPDPLDLFNPGGGSAMAKIGALGCRENISSHILSYITKIQPRRLLIVDEEKGLVFGFPMLVHRGNVRKIDIVGVPGVTTVPMNFGPINLQSAEIFKISGGKIHEIEAMGFLLPYGLKTGWE